jgi:integrase
VLTDTALRNAKPKEKPYRMADGRGLYLEVRPKGVRSPGSKLWRYRFRLGGKENMYAIGEYPGVSLQEAREKRDAARKLVKEGINPAAERQRTRLQNIEEGKRTFRAVAEEWVQKKGQKWAPRNRTRIEAVLRDDVYPHIGRIPIKSVTPAHILEIMERVADRGAPTVAVDIRQLCHRVFARAIARQLIQSNPAAGAISDAIVVPAVRNHPHLEPDELKGFAVAINGYSGEPATKLALRLLLLTFVRSGELRGAQWKEFDLDAKEWRIPAERMKMREPHLVPLSDQAVAALKDLHALTGRSKLLFPNARSPLKHMATTTLNAALVRLGYKGKFSPHGVRSTASTILHEMGYQSAWIERQLAHRDSNAVRRSYNRAEYLAERRQMMQQWADLLDELSSGSKKVVPGRFQRSAA